ncbi:MAG: response regulator transcription factor [Turneriella sp.]|nr:response regulator transcription factor [Turneriella sp.]
MPYSVSIVEDRAEVAGRLREQLLAASDFVFSAYYANAEQALAGIEKDACDLLLLDIGLPGMSGVDAIPFLLKTRPPLKIVVLTVFENPSLITRALGYGAKGYLLKGISAELLHAELKVVMLGGSALTAAVAAQLMEKFETPAEAPDTASLTPREKEVLNLLALGMTYTDCADDLEISPHTVRRHIENIYAKLNINSRAEIIRLFQNADV